MRYPFVDLQTRTRDFLLYLGEWGFPLWLATAIFLFIILGFSVYACHLNFSLEPKKFKGQKLIGSQGVFVSIIALLIIILKIPAFALFEINPDESQWIASAATLAKDPRFWYSVDGTTSGPLVVFPLTVIHLLGGTINYGTIRLLGAVIWVLTIVSIYRSFSNLFGEIFGRIIILPMLMCVATFSYFDYVTYNGEHVPILLISIAFFLLSKLILAEEKTKKISIFLLSFSLGLVPYSKLQAAPIAIVMAGMMIFFLNKKQILIYVLGGIAPTVFVLMYLVSFNVFDDFFKSYILNNIAYAKEGALFHGIGIDASRDLAMTERIFLFPHLLLNAIETRYYFIFLFSISILAGFFCFVKRKMISIGEKKLIAIGVLMLVTSCYAVIQPGNDYGHYVLLTIAPITILTGILLGLVKTHQTKIQNKGIVLAFVFITVIFPLPHNLYACKNAYLKGPIELILSSPAKQVLKYADPGERLAIWGWANIYYVETHMIQGTREPHTERQIRKSELKEYYLQRYVSDLAVNKPTVLIDAVGKDRSNFRDRKTEGHENFPLVKNLIDSLYLFAAEIEDVRIYVLKEKANGRQYKRISCSAENIKLFQKNNISYTIEKYEEGESYISFSGWAFINGMGTEEGDVEILLKNDANSFSFKTSYIYRRDITKFFKASGLNLDYAGFSVVVPKEPLKAGEYRVALKITNLKTGEQSIQETDHFILNQPQSFVFFKRVLPGEKPILVDMPHEQEAAMDYQLERFENSGEAIDISGWAHIKGKDAKDKVISLIFRSAANTYRMHTKPVLRPDVTNYFKEKNLDLNLAGFSANFKNADIISGNYDVGIEIVDIKTNKPLIFFINKQLKIK